jgi:hypothetical protein
MSSYSSWKPKSKHKIGILLILWNVNNMYVHDILQKITLWHKKWATIPCKYCLVIKSQTTNLIHDHYLNHNLLSNLKMKNIKSVIISKVSFQ